MQSTAASPITLGVYYAGHPHEDAHANDIANSPDVGCAAVCSPDETAAAWYAAKIPGSYIHTGGWHAMLADLDIPAVCILADNATAGRLTLQAIEHGKWVYADKPGAASLKQMQAIVDAAAATGAHFCPCYTRRMFDETTRMADLIAGGAIGNIRSFSAVWLTSTSTIRGAENWLFHHKYAGGGIVYWLGCHWIDVLRFVTGSRVAAVSAMTSTLSRSVDVEEIACATLRLENGAIGTFRVAYVLDPFPGYTPSDLLLDIQGSRGSLTLTPSGADRVLRLRSRAPGFENAAESLEIAVPGHNRSGYASELLAAFLQALRAGTAPPATEADALYVMQVAEAIYTAAQNRSEQPLNWPPEQ